MTGRTVQTQPITEVQAVEVHPEVTGLRLHLHQEVKVIVHQQGVTVRGHHLFQEVVRHILRVVPVQCVAALQEAVPEVLQEVLQEVAVDRI